MLNILIVDDHPLARKGIKSILKGNIENCCVSEEACVKGALGALRLGTIHVMFVDLNLGGEFGLDIVREGGSISPGTKFILITTYISKEDYKTAEELNVSGYLSKSAAPEDIVYIVDLVTRGKKYIDSDLIAFDKSDRSGVNTAQLTDREREVLTELAKGISNEEIAKRLFISINTVKKHISSIMSKLNLQNRMQLILYVNKYGLASTGLMCCTEAPYISVKRGNSLEKA